jgi:hypothetical protein
VTELEPQFILQLEAALAERNLWRIDDDRPVPIAAAGIGEERRLESIIADDLAILGLGPLLLVGRQVATDFGGRVDLLAIDQEGTTYVIELKRGRTAREVIAQVLDYGAWARDLSADLLTRIFETGRRLAAAPSRPPSRTGSAGRRRPRSTTLTGWSSWRPSWTLARSALSSTCSTPTASR